MQDRITLQDFVQQLQLHRERIVAASGLFQGVLDRCMTRQPFTSDERRSLRKSLADLAKLYAGFQACVRPDDLRPLSAAIIALRLPLMLALAEAQKRMRTLKDLFAEISLERRHLTTPQLLAMEKVIEAMQDQHAIVAHEASQFMDRVHFY